MRPSFLAACGAVAGIISNLAVAIATPTPSQIPVDEIPVPPPRPAPLAGAPGPTTAPAVAAAPVSVAPGSKIVLLPFEVLGDPSNRQWVGRALQDSLTAEVARLSNLSPVEANAPGDTIDTAAAIAAAKSSGGDVVVYGAYQFNDPEIRMTGQVVDVASGQAIAGLKVSGEFRDLFSLEDQLGSQLRSALRPQPPMTAQDKLANDQAIFGQPTPPLTTDDLYATPGYNPQFQDAYNRYYYDWSDFPFGYGYGGGYGGYGYGYGGGVGFGGGNGFGHGGFGGGHHRHRVGYTPPAAPPATPPLQNQITIGSTVAVPRLPDEPAPRQFISENGGGGLAAPPQASAPPSQVQPAPPPQPIIAPAAPPQQPPPPEMRPLNGH